MGPKARRGRPRRHQPARKRMCTTVNLDGASSSENEEQSPCNIGRKPIDMHITNSPEKMSRGIMSDSPETDSDLEVDHVATAPKSTARVTTHPDNSGSESSDDIFDINYLARKQSALKKSYKELTVNEEKPSKIILPKMTRLSDKSDIDDDGEENDCWIEEQPANPSKRQEKNSIPQNPPSPPLFEIDKSVRRKETCRRTRRNGTIIHGPVLQQGNKRCSSSKCVSNDILDLSSDVLLSDDDEDVNPEIRVRIKWGSDNFRLPIKKLQKFAHLYEVLAKRYGVSTNRIVLNLNDKIINPAHTPADLGVTIADLIDGGTVSTDSQNPGQRTVPQITKDPNSISVRVQSSNKKSSVTITMGIREKMSVLMHKYAEERRLQLDKLRFLFDGEELCTSSTPLSLEMEDGECIDVYEHT